jgi:hypothetical protein
LHDATTGEKLLTTTTTSGGNYSFTWYDNVSNVFVEAYQDATHVGRSSNDVAS